MSKVSWLKRLSRFFAGERSTLAARLAEEAFPRLYPIQLEDRQVLDGAPLVQLDAQGMVTVGAGAAANDGQADTFEVTRVETDSGAMMLIKVNDQTAAEFRFDDVRQLRVEGSQDEDTLVLDARAVPIDGVEFLGNAIPGSDVLAGGAAGPDRLVILGLGPFDASPSNSTGTSSGGSGPTANPTVSLTYQLDTTTSTAATADGSWQVAFQGVEHVVDQLSVDDRQIIVAAGLDADLRGGDEHGTGWTTVEVAGGPILEMRNSLESLGVTATNVTVSGNADLSGADARLTATESLTVAASGQLLSGGGNLELSAPQMLIAGVVDVGAGGSARLDVGSTGLMIVSGTIRATGDGAGENGGLISLRGDFVRLLPTARLDATGSAGGGQILVGSTGDVSVDPELGSRGVWIEAGVVIDASALRAGDGGRVIVWGTEGIVVDGLLRATGGSESGDGGFVETSTRGGFSLTAAPVVTAPMGQGGTWLIDPFDLEIVAAAGSAGFVATGSSPSFTFTSDLTHSQLGIATLLASMGNGITVELKTGPGMGGAGNITLSTDIDYNTKGTGTLKFTADHSIILNGKIYDSDLMSADALSVVLTAGTDGLGTSTTSINADVATRGGSFTATGDNFTLAATKSIQTLGGATSVTTTAGKVIAINGSLNVGAGALTLTADDLVLAGGPNSIVGTGVVTLQPLNPAATIGIGGGAGTFTLTSGDLDSLANGFSQIVIGRADGTGGFNILATTFRDPVLLQSPTGGTINIDGTLTGIDNASLTIDGAGATTVLSANVVTAGTAITFSDNVQVDAAVLVDSTNAGAVPAGAAINFLGTVDATAAMGAEALMVNAGSAGNVTFSAAIGGAQILDGLNVTGNLVTVGAINMGTGPLTITGNDVVLGGASDSIVGTGVVTLQPLDPATTIGIAGGTGSFNVTTAELATLANGFSQILIGRANGTGGINLLATTFRDPVVLRSPSGGTINVDGTLTGTDNASITIDGSGATTVLSANVVTAGNVITFSDNVQVDAAVLVDSTNGGAVPAGANISFLGTVDATIAMGAESLTVTAGNLGDVTFTGAVGTTEALDSLDVTADLINAGAISMGAGPLTFTANDVVLGGPAGSIVGTGVVTLQPLTAATTIGLGGAAGTFTLTTAELGTLADGFAQIVIGRADGTGGININASTFRDPVLLRSPSGGTINVDGAVTGTGDASFAFRGLTTLSANVVTAGATITFEDDVQVDAAVVVDSTTANAVPAGANIDFQGTVDATAAMGAESLTVNAGNMGDATFTGAVGSTQALDALDATGDLVTVHAISMGPGPLTLTANNVVLAGAANSITGTGIVTLQPLDPATVIGISGGAGTFTLTTAELATLANGFSQIVIGRANGTGGINLNATTFRDPVLLRSPLGGVINVDATLTGTDNASITVQGFTVLSANVVTAGDTIKFENNVEIDDDVQVNSNTGAPLGANIDFLGTVNATAGAGSKTLNVKSGTSGDVTFAAAVGASEPLDALTVNGDAVSFASTVAVAGPLVVFASGATTFSNKVTTTTASGNVTLTNMGLLTIASGADFTLSGSFNQNGAGNVALGANILTANKTINFSSPVTLTKSVTLNSNNAVGTGANITLGSDVTGTDATQTLTLTAGSAGDISAEALGTGAGNQRLGGLTITAADVVTATSIATAGGLTVTADTLTVSGATNSWNAPVTITVTHSGAGNALQLAAVDTRGQNLTISSADSISFTGGANSIQSSTTGGSLTLQGTTVATTIGLGTGAAGAVQLTDTSLAAIGPGFTGGIFFGRTGQTGLIALRGASQTYDQNVTIRADGGANVDLGATLSTTEGGAVGKTVSILGAPTSVILLDKNIITAGGAITVAGVTQISDPVLVDSTNAGAAPNGANVLFQGTVTGAGVAVIESLTVKAGTMGDVTFTGTVGSAPGFDGLSVTGDVVLFSSTVAVAGPLTVVSSGATTFTNTVTTTTANGNVLLTNSGLLTIPSGGNFTLSGTFTQNGAGNVSLGANVLTANKAISFTSPVTLTSNVVLNSNNAVGTGANITLSGAVAGTDATQTLTLVAGSAGDISAQALGTGTGLQRLGGLTITSADEVSAMSIATAGGLTSTSNKLTVTGATDSWTAPVNITVNHAGLGNALQLAAVDTHGQNLTISSAGAVAFTGGPNSVQSLSPSGGIFTLQGTTVATTLGLGTGAAGAVQLLDASIAAIGPGFTGGIVFGRSGQTGQITFSGPNHNYDQNVTIRADGGATVDLGAPISTTEGGAVNKSLTILGGPTSVITLSRNIVTAGGGIAVSGIMQVSGAITVDSTNAGAVPAGADIDFTGTVNATLALTPESLTVNAGTMGDVIFTSSVGNLQALDALSVTGNDVLFSSTVKVAGPLTVVSSGATTFTNTVTTTGLLGNVILTNTGLLTIPSGGTFTLSGSFNQNGMGDVALGANVLTPNKTISFSSPVTLTSNVLLNSNNAIGTGADITFGGDVVGTNATQTLTLVAGSGGDISAQALGTGAGNERLGGLTITSAKDVSAASIATAGGLTSTSSTLTVTGAIDSWDAPVTITVNHAGPANALQLAAVDTRGQDLTISSAGPIAFTGGLNSVQSSTTGGSFTLQGTTVATTLGLGTGAAGAVQLDDASIGAIGPGFTGGIFFGRTGQTGQITLRGANHAYDQNVTIRANGGATVDLGAALSTTEGGADDKFVSIVGGAASQILLGGNISTDGGKITVTGNTLRVMGMVDRTLSTSLAVNPAATAGDIDLSGLTQILGSGGSRLLIDSRHGGTSNGMADDGQVDLPAIVGSATAADSLGLLDVRTDTGKTILRNSGGTSTIRVVGTAGSTSLFINGPVQLTGTTSISVTPGDIDLSEAIFSSKGVTPMSLTVSSIDGNPLTTDGIVRLGAMDDGDVGDSRVKDVTITTADGSVPPGMLIFDHPGMSPLSIDIAGNFTHTGERVIVADDTSITTQGGNILLNGQIDASAPNISLVLDASMPTGGIVNPGEIGSFGGGNFLSEVRLITNNNSGKVILNDNITIDDPAGTGAGVVVVGRTEVASTVTIRSESGDDDAGAPINFANAVVYGDVPGRSLTLDSHSATSTAGQVSLGPVSNNGGAGSYLQSLLINSTGTGGGAPLQLSNNISLDGHGGVPALFQFQGGNVEITTVVIIDTEQGNDAAGGDIDLGTSRVSATTFDKTLTLDARGLATGGAIVLGGANSSGGDFLGGLTLLTNGAGRIVPGGDLLVDAQTAVFPERGVRIEGVVALPHAAGSTWTIDTEQGDDLSAAPINLDAAIIAADHGNVSVALNSNGSIAAAPITLGSFDPPAGLTRITSLTINAVGGATGDVTFNDVAHVNGPISVTASSVISGDGQLVADDLTLAAGTGIYGDDATSPLKVQTPILDVSTTIGGDVRILNSFAGPVTLEGAQAAGSGSIDYQQTGLGTLNISGDVTTAGTGSIEIETDGAIHLAGATLRTEGTGTHISVSAGGALTETGGQIVVGNSNAATRAIVSTFPLDTNATAKDYNNGLNVDPLRNSQVTVTIVNAVPGDKGYTVDLDWGVPASMPNVQTDLSITAPSQAYNHTYSAVVPIPPAIPVTVTVDMDSRIALTANTNAVAQDLTTSTTVVVLNAEGTFFSFAQVIPGLVSSTPRVVVPLSLRPQPYVQPTVAPPVRVAETSTVSMSAQNVVDRQFVLRLVLPDDLAKNEKPPERNLGDEDLDDLPGLFKRLFDGRYQIWLKLEDGSEQLVKDFYIRDGKAIDLEDVAPDVSDEVPAAKPETPPRPVPMIDAPGESELNAPPLSPPARSDSSPGIDREAAVDWSDRAREALGQVDERAFSKARRLLRRGSV